MFSDGRCPAFLLVAKGLIRWEYWNISLPEFFIKHKVICKMRSLKPIIGAYQGHTIAPINLTNSGRLDSLVRAGKIYLSLQDAIALALENNLDIEVQRYALPLAQADLLRAKAGAAIRGISTSVAGSNQGSSSQSLTNTTTSTTTAGTPGGITSTLYAGPLTQSLDPVVQGQLNWGHYSSPQTNTLFTGVTSLVQRQSNYNFSIGRGFLT